MDRVADVDRVRTAKWALVFGATGVAVAMTWIAFTDAAPLLWGFSPFIAVGTLACLAGAWLTGRGMCRVLIGNSVGHACLAGVLTAWSALLGGTAAGALFAFCLGFAELSERGFAHGVYAYVLLPIAVVGLYGGLPAIVLGLVFSYVVRTRRATRVSASPP